MLLRAGVQEDSGAGREGSLCPCERASRDLGPHLVGEQLFWAGCLQNDSGEVGMGDPQKRRPDAKLWG